MKLCIPVATPDGLHAAFEGDFGTARHLIVLDSNGYDRRQSIHAIDRTKPELTSAEVVTGIGGVLCGDIEPSLLFQLQQGGIQVFECKATSAAAALAQFRAGKLHPLPRVERPSELEQKHSGCGGGPRDDAHQCCGGKGQDGDDGHQHGHNHAAHENPDPACRRNGGCGCKH
jgi:predicted Fe-Mo cluster-binding NifX family protein